MLSARSLAALSGTRLLSVFYHTCFEVPPPYFSGMYSVRTPQQFEADIDQLLSEFTPVGLSDLLAAKHIEDLPPRSFFLSFDDGYREVAETVAPILSRKGVPATLFVCSDFIDNRSWFFEDQVALVRHRLQGRPDSVHKAVATVLERYGQTVDSLGAARIAVPEALADVAAILEFDWQVELRSFLPYVTTSQVHSLIRHGFSIGAHGTDHTHFHLLSVEEQLQQIRESCTTIAAQFGLSYRVLSFPYGEYTISADVLRAVRDQGIANALFGTRGLIQDELYPFIHHRLCCESPSRSLSSHIRGHLAERVLRRWRHKDCVIRQIAHA
ncbi:MAG: polysaccharide deacetylase family protein [Planctomycetaceae bacterium]|nr:polysaccharide deacetylase family protein [Planctomycetaceae bacterium]